MLKSKPAILFFIFFITLLSVIGTVSLPPALPVIAQLFGVAKADIGMIMSLYTLPGIFLTPVFGYFADKFGRKRILIPSLILFGIFSICCFFATSYSELLLWRFFQGVSAASLGSLNIVLINDYYNNTDKNKILGLNSAVMSLGTAAFPIMTAGLLHFGWNFPFLISSFSILVGLFGGLFFKDAFTITPNSTINPDTNSSRKLLWIYIVSAMTYIILFGCFMTYLPFLISDVLVGKPIFTGLSMTILSVGTLLVALFFGYLSKKTSQYKLLAFSFLIYTISLILFVTASSITQVLIASFIYGCGNAVNFPNTQSIISKLSNPSRLATNLSFNRMSILLGQTIGPLLMGIVFKYSDLNTVFFGGIFLSFLTFVIVYFNRAFNSKSELL
ncbi:MAG: MFS transporter [Ignavibacteria bacterium]|nr:MFS transporter [Ignavibacteria bacterium]